MSEWGCDWFQAGFRCKAFPSDFFLSPIADLFPGRGNAFYESSLEDGVGMRVYHTLRPSFPQNPAFTVEIKGSWFASGGRLDALLVHWKSQGFSFSIQRFDARWDFRHPVEKVTPVSTCGATVQEWTVNGQWSGFRVGKNDRVWRLYDKRLEQGKKAGDGAWWRLELVIRGEYKDDLFGDSEMDLVFRAFDLGVSALDWGAMGPFWYGWAQGLVSKRLVRVSASCTFEGAYQYALRQVVSAVRGLSKHFNGRDFGVKMGIKDVAEGLLEDAFGRILGDVDIAHPD